MTEIDADSHRGKLDSSSRLRKFGIIIVGEIPWGTHLCQFYDTRNDLIDILVPYFVEGLKNNEFCMWVTSPPLEVEAATKALKKAVPNLDEYVNKGQIEILSYKDWYLLDGQFDAERVLHGWVQKEEEALGKGFDGLRLTGNTFWIERKDWKSFTDYETTVNNVIGSHRMIALCTYSLRKCKGSDVVDVEKNHVGTLIRKGTSWSLVEDTAQRKEAESIAQQSEERYSVLIDSAPDAIIVHHEGKVLYANQSAVDLYGAESFEQLAFHNVMKLIPPAEIEESTRRVQTLMEGQKVPLREARIIRLDGQEIPVEVTSSPVEYKGVRVAQAILRNISGRKKAENALRETRDYLDSLLNYANAPIIVWDSKFKVTKFNRAFEHLTGYTEEEVLGKNLSMLFPEQSKEKSLTEIQHTLAGEHWEIVEIPILRKDRDVRTVLWNSANIYAEDGRTIVATIAQGQDITERKRAEEALKASEEQLRRAVEDAPIPVIMHAEDGQVLQLSKTWTALTGYSLSDIPSFDAWLTNAVYGEGANEVRDHMHELFKGSKASMEAELPIHTIDGKIRYWSFSASSPGILRDGRRFIVGMALDVTERKKLEEQLRNAERMAAIGETAAMVGHDLRNPLQAIVGFISITQEQLQNTNCPPQEKETLKEPLKAIADQSHYMNKIVSDLQDYAAPMNPELQETSIAELADAVILTMQIPDTVQVSVEIPKDFTKIPVDPLLMKRVFTNLFRNSIEAMANGGKLTIDASRTDGAIFINVKDTGIGIAQENQPKIFKPLFTTKAKGQGLGLPVCKRIIEAHGGTITFQSQEGQGTTFTLRMPSMKNTKQ